MKRTLINGMIAFAMLFAVNTQASAQGFLKKVSKAASSLTSKTSETTDSVASDTAQVKAPNWDTIPEYELVAHNLTDNSGNPVLNEDGSQKVRVLFRNKKDSTEYKSSEVIEKQIRELDKITTRIIAKVGGGAAIGVVGGLLAGGKKKGTGALVGGVAGTAAGLALSAGDIKRAREVNKQTKELQKVLQVYQTNFTREGVPVNASADLTNIEGINFMKNQTAAIQEDIDARCKSEAFNADLSWN